MFADFVHFSLQTSWQVIQLEVLSHLVPIFINNHPNTSNVLNFVWHSQVSSHY